MKAWGRAPSSGVWHRLRTGGRGRRSLCGAVWSLEMVQDALPEEADVCGREECGFINPLVCVCSVPDAHPRIDFGMCKHCSRKPLALFSAAL